MIKFVKQIFIALLSFSESLACIAKFHELAKRISQNNEPCLARQPLVNLNSNKFHYYPFMVSLERCNEKFNSLDDSRSRIYLTNKTKDVN